ncbi:unnamed protein product, partial [Effrenium voratum]
ILFFWDPSQSGARIVFAGMALTVPEALSRVEELLAQLRVEAEAEAETAAPPSPEGRCPRLPSNLSRNTEVVLSPVESNERFDQPSNELNKPCMRSMHGGSRASLTPSSGAKMERFVTQNTEADGPFPPHPRLRELLNEALERELGMPRRMFSQLHSPGSANCVQQNSWRAWRASLWEEATGWLASLMILADLVIMPVGAFVPLLGQLLSVVLMCPSGSRGFRMPCLPGVTRVVVLPRRRLVRALDTPMYSERSGYEIETLLRPQALRALLLPKYLRKITATRRVKACLCQCSREVSAMWNILLLLLVGLLCLHWLTALWYSLGTRPRGWAAHHDLESFSLLQKYEAALEFGLSRLHPSRLATNLKLKTQPEKVLAVFATFAALVLGGIFTSLVTNDLSDIRRKQRTKQEAEQQLQEFLLAYPVHHRLEAALTKYLAKWNSRQRAVSKNQVASHFPDFLFQELCQEAFTPLLSKHHFFLWLRESFTAFSKDLCASLQDRHMMPQELLFAAGSSCNAMVWVAHGQVKYTDKGKDFCASEDLKGFFSMIPKKVGVASISDVKMLNAGDWMCEACLWTPWQYQGQAVAAGGTLLCLDHETVVSLGLKHMEVTADLANYARQFLAALQDEPSDFTSVIYEPLTPQA